MTVKIIFNFNNWFVGIMMTKIRTRTDTNPNQTPTKTVPKWRHIRFIIFSVHTIIISNVNYNSIFIFTQFYNIISISVSTSNIVGASICKNGSTLATYKIVTMLAFDDVTAFFTLATITN